MGFLFNAAKVANGLSGVASALAYGGSGVSIRQASEGVVDLGAAMLNLINPDLYLSGGYGYVPGMGRSVVSATGGYPTEWLTQYISRAWSENGLINYLYGTLFKTLTPDISGYTLLFMVPPVLSGYSAVLGNQNYDLDSDSSFLSETAKLCPLVATNFTPPSIQLNTGSLSGSSGTQHYAAELNITDSMSVTYLDTINLDVYSFHSSWVKYIFQILEGTLEPHINYIKGRMIDYAASFYFVKFLPNASEIQYVGKAVGCIPKELSAQEVLGSRTSNDSTTVTFSYTVSNYYEATALEQGNWLFQELQDVVMSRYQQG